MRRERWHAGLPLFNNLQTIEMDKNDLRIEQLSRRLKRLEMDHVLDDLPESVSALVDDLGLVPVSKEKTPCSAPLTGEGIRSILEELGYICRQGDIYTEIISEKVKVTVFFDQLPLITLSAGYRLNETEEGLKSVKQAAEDVTKRWDMVKALFDPEGPSVLVNLKARHHDQLSFEQNIRFYIDQVVAATEGLMDRYRFYEKERWLKGLGGLATTGTLS